MATFSDHWHVLLDPSNTSNYFKVPVVVKAQDYYPFGMEMPGRTYSANGEYRFGFNGKESDKNGEWGGLTHYDYGFRIYNPAIARFLSVDPLAPDYPWYTPYQFAGNTPIMAIDLDGLEPTSSIEDWKIVNRFPHGTMYKADDYYVWTETADDAMTVHSYYDPELEKQRIYPWVPFDEQRPKAMADDVTNIAVTTIGFVGAAVLGAGFIEAIGPYALPYIKQAGSAAKAYLAGYYATHGARDAKEAIWGAYKDIQLRNVLEVDKFAYEFIPIPNSTIKGGIKNVLDSRLDFNLEKKQEGGLILNFEKRQTTGLDLGRAFYEGILDSGTGTLDKTLKDKGSSSSYMREAGQKMLDYLLDRVIQGEQDRQGKQNNNGG